MRVYCVVMVDGEYGFHDLDSVHSTREKAQAWIDTKRNKWSTGQEPEIEEMEVDPDLKTTI